jgi:hypothetical protein
VLNLLKGDIVKSKVAIIKCKEYEFGGVKKSITRISKIDR